ncbi:MAG: ABC transporter ATP-binding protein [Candidatus Izemoplasmatales bacterium]|nr:ABC transporter ATP-binding protein [Candidatus Izemoplasmatales bacterium]
MSIEVINVYKSFQKQIVLSNLSVSAFSSEIVGLIGPSGAGKTTLIRLITGAIKADKGKVTIDGTLVPSMKLFANIGFMPQSDALYPDLSGIDNLLFFGRLYGLKGKTLLTRVEFLLKFIDLFEDRNKLVFQYSGGMKKRLSLIIALLHDPSYLILDEPTVGIDPVLRKKIWDYFHELAKIGKTLVISTHVMDEAESCDKCALIYKGKLLAFDTVCNLKLKTKSGKIEELFFNQEEVD